MKSRHYPDRGEMPDNLLVRSSCE